MLEGPSAGRVHAEHGKEIDAGGNRQDVLRLAAPNQRFVANSPGKRR